MARHRRPKRTDEWIDGTAEPWKTTLRHGTTRIGIFSVGDTCATPSSARSAVPRFIPECYGSSLPLAEESRRKRAVASTGLVKW
jgi:hypothetical protein